MPIFVIMTLRGIVCGFNFHWFMKGGCLFFLSVAVLLAACSSGDSRPASDIRFAERDSLLVVLDRTVEHKPDYIQARQNRIDSLKALFIRESDMERKLQTGQAMFELYFDFQNDIAMEHIETMQRLSARIASTHPGYYQLATIDKVALLRFMGHLKEADELLDEIGRTPIAPEVYPSYISERMMNYAYLYNNNSHPEYKAYYDRMTETYRDSLLMCSGQKQKTIVWAERLVKQKQLEAALDLLHGAYDGLDPTSKRAGVLAYNIALCHEAMSGEENRVESERYLILSGISDLRNGVRGYKSLPRLAIRMYDSGDIDRAYNYMKCSIEDAINSSAHIRTQEISEMFVLVNESYELKNVKQQQRVVGLLVVIGSICALLFVLLLFIGYQNVQLVSVKEKLSNANLTKEGYMGVFVEAYSNHLARMNSFRLKSVKILKTGNLPEIEAFVDRVLNMTDDQEELHRQFDAAILSIFPTFIEEYNRLMKENERMPGKGKLTNEQRIAAFIRLGITEPEKIALFLRYSIRTVYNYRSQMRSKAKNPKKFEKEIMQIGLIRIPTFLRSFGVVYRAFAKIFRSNRLT